jgi:hypothetical protein
MVFKEIGKLGEEGEQGSRGAGEQGSRGAGVTKDNILQVPKSLMRVEKHPCYDGQDYSSSPS